MNSLEAEAEDEVVAGVPGQRSTSLHAHACARSVQDVGVFIAGSPINITVNNIKEINNNQELIFDIEVNSNTEEVLKNIQLKVEYPFGYKLLESNPKPIADNNIWSFDT